MDTVIALTSWKAISQKRCINSVPLSELAAKPDHVQILEKWMKSYRPEELFDDSARLFPHLAERAPTGDARMGANPHANGGLLLRLPDFRDYPVKVPAPGQVEAEATRVMGQFLRDVMKYSPVTITFLRMAG